MNKLLVSTIVSSLLFTMNAFAGNNSKGDDANKQANFVKNKAMHIEGIQQDSSFTNCFKLCKCCNSSRTNAGLS